MYYIYTIYSYKITVCYNPCQFFKILTVSYNKLAKVATPCNIYREMLIFAKDTPANPWSNGHSKLGSYVFIF